MANIKGSVAGKPNIFVYTASGSKLISSSEFTSGNTKIIYGLDTNRNILSYTPGQADFLQGFLSLENNKGYYSVNTQDITVTGIVPVDEPSATTTTTSSTTTTTTSSGLNPNDFNPASVGATHRWSAYASTITKDVDNKISQINDAIGTANLVPFSTYYPIYKPTALNSRPAISLDNSFNYAPVFTDLTEAPTGNILVIMVININKDIPSGISLFDGATNQSGALVSAGITNSSALLTLGAETNKNITTSSAITPGFGGKIVSCLFNTTASKLYVNGAQVSSGIGLNAVFNKLTLGIRGDLSGTAANYDMLDTIFVPNPTLSAHNYCGSYLAAIYGLTWSTVS